MLPETKPCQQCGYEKALSEYWNNKRSWDRKDKVCITCRESNRAARESTPAGIYELQSRLLVAIFRTSWFPRYDELWHIDHKFSITAGFEHNVPLNVINNRNNLDLILKSENLRKGSDCSITKQQLYETFLPDPKLDYWVSKIEPVKNRETLRRWTNLTNAIYKPV